MSSKCDMSRVIGNEFLEAVHANDVPTVRRLLLEEGMTNNMIVEGLSRRTPLHSASLLGYTGVVQALIELDKILDINVTDRLGRTALLLACRRHEEEVVRLLVSHKDVDVNAKNTLDEYTALHFACDLGNTQVVQLLLNHDSVKVNALDGLKHTPLYYAARGNHVEVTRLLLERPHINLEVGQDNPLIAASKEGHAQIGQLLLQHDGVNDEKAWTTLALIAASKEGHAQIVQLLLQHDGVNVNGTDEKAWTALAHAVISHHVPIVGLLLDHPKIDSTMQNGPNGMTAFSIACSRRGSLAVARLFLERPEIRRRTLNLQNWDGSTPLALSVRHEKTEIVRLLLNQEGINVNMQDADGYRPLHHVCCKDEGSTELAQLLLRHPTILPNIQKRKGWTPLQVACLMGNKKVVQLLLSHNKTDANIQNNLGQTALWVAYNHKQMHIMELLLRHGVNTGLKDRYGQTVLHDAACKSPEAVKLLLQHGVVNGKLKNHRGKLALDLACESGTLDAIFLLLRRAIEDSTVTFFKRTSKK